RMGRLFYRLSRIWTCCVMSFAPEWSGDGRGPSLIRARQRKSPGIFRRPAVIIKWNYVRQVALDRRFEADHEYVVPSKEIELTKENMSGFAALGVTGILLKGVEAAGLTEPKPIQTQAIPPQLEGRDILGIAQTGS